MMTQTQFDADPSMTAKAMALIAANDDDILASDPAYLQWLDQRALEFEIERGLFYV